MKNVTVIIVAKDAEKTLPSCLNSIMDKQTLNPLEVIVVDNGSKDRTSEIAIEFGATVVKEPILGRARARNTGILKAKADLIAFTDSDCIADRNWLFQLVKRYEQGGCVGVAGNVYALNSNRLIPKLIDRLVRDKPHYATWNIMYEKKVLLEIGLFRDFLKNAEDVDLAWRLLDKGYQIAYEPKAIVYHAHREKLFDFFYQQFDYGKWSCVARRSSGKSTIKANILAFIGPLTFFKHLSKALWHPLFPFLLALSSTAYGLGSLKGLKIWSKIRSAQYS
jgi:glycosyltransferase involved in cell wall biosynthesis